jgi:hypothetical protein
LYALPLVVSVGVLCIRIYISRGCIFLNCSNDMGAIMSEDWRERCLNAEAERDALTFAAAKKWFLDEIEKTDDGALSIEFGDPPCIRLGWACPKAKNADERDDGCHGEPDNVSECWFEWAAEQRIAFVKPKKQFRLHKINLSRPEAPQRYGGA